MPFVGKIVALHLRYLESNLVVPSAVAVRFSIVGQVTVSDESSAVLFKHVSCVAEPRASALAQGFPFSPQYFACNTGDTSLFALLGVSGV